MARDKEGSGQIYYECTTYQKVKIEYQRPSGSYHPLKVPGWKWEVVSMDFVNGFLCSQKRNESISIVVHMIIYLAHFIPIKAA